MILAIVTHGPCLPHEAELVINLIAETVGVSSFLFNQLYLRSGPNEEEIPVVVSTLWMESSPHYWRKLHALIKASLGDKLVFCREGQTWQEAVFGLKE